MSLCTYFISGGHNFFSQNYRPRNTLLQATFVIGSFYKAKTTRKQKWLYCAYHVGKWFKYDRFGSNSSQPTLGSPLDLGDPWQPVLINNFDGNWASTTNSVEELFGVTPMVSDQSRYFCSCLSKHRPRMCDIHRDIFVTSLILGYGLDYSLIFG